MESRRFRRFVVPFKMEVLQAGRNILGAVKDFSRFGIRAVFENFDLEPGAPIDFRLEKIGKDICVSASGVVVWKRYDSGKWDAGIRLVDFPPQLKSDMLEEAYRNWIRDVVGANQE